MKFLRSLCRLRTATTVCLLALAALGPACSLLPHHKEDAGTPGVSDSSPAALKAGSLGLAVELKASPDPIKLGEVRQLDVTFTLRNTTRRTVELEFPTSQTIEIILREQAGGKIVSQWSTDQTFLPSSRSLVINAHERIEYNQPITTREMHPGVTYTLEAYVVGHEKDLRATRPIIPLP